MTDQNPEGTAAAEAPAAEADECAECLGGRVILLAVLFAAFAAYVAADFATGGRLTTGALGVLAAVRGRAGGGPGNA